MNLRAARVPRGGWTARLGGLPEPPGAWLLLEDFGRVSLAAVHELSGDVADSARGRLFCPGWELRWAHVGPDAVRVTWAGKGEGPGWLAPLDLGDPITWERERRLVLRGVERIDLGRRLDPGAGVLCLVVRRARRDDGTVAWERLVDLAVDRPPEKRR